MDATIMLAILRYVHFFSVKQAMDAMLTANMHGTWHDDTLLLTARNDGHGRTLYRLYPWHAEVSS